MQRRIRFRPELNVGQFAGEIQHRFQIAFQIIEINGLFRQIPVLVITVAANHPCQHQILTNAQICLGIRHETQTGFKDTHAVLLTVLVIDHR